MYSIVNGIYYFDGFNQDGSIKVTTDTYNHKKFTWNDITQNIMPLLPEDWIVKVTE